ncbi:MAG: universal stress protein [Prochloraceae cyanobacterium]
MFNSCLICTDFSDGLHRLIDFVPSLAKNGLQQIVFCHTVPLWEQGEVPRIDTDKINEATEYLSRAKKTVPQGVELKIEVLSGRPVENILRILETYQIDVILLGTPIRSVWQEKVFGSTSMELARSTSVPILILRPQLISTYTNEELALRCQHLWRYLLIPYNDSRVAHYLIEQIKDYARNRPENSLKQFLLVWAIDDGGREVVITEQRLQDARQKLESVKAELEQLDLEVNIEVRQGNPVQEILDSALTFDISAIAIATDYQSNLLEWAIPSCADELLRRSWFPVLFFSPKK